MDLIIQITWKILVKADGDVDLFAKNKNFNIRTGKTFLRNIGGINSLNYFPYVLEPTNVFYNSLNKIRDQYNFQGKRLPFKQINSNDWLLNKNINVKIHRYSRRLAIITLSLERIRFSGKMDELKSLLDIENHEGIYGLAKTVCSIVSSSGKRIVPISNKPKIYPCIAVESSDYARDISDKAAIELLTRHLNPRKEIIDKVIEKNINHQLDENSVLIDRQGIFARYACNDLNEYSIERKFNSALCLFELAMALSDILDTKDHHNLTDQEKNELFKLISKPNIVFVKSVTSYETWLLLIKEFKLEALFSEYQEYESNKDGSIGGTGKLISKNPKKEWDDRKKWIMGIIAGIILVIVSLLAKSFWPEILKRLK